MLINTYNSWQTVGLPLQSTPAQPRLGRLLAGKFVSALVGCSRGATFPATELSRKLQTMEQKSKVIIFQALKKLDWTNTYSK